MRPRVRRSLASFGMAAGAIMLILAIPYIACGIGLLKRKRWARILGIVLGAVALIRFPIGTAFGVYALVILFRKDTEALFTGSDRGQTVRPRTDPGLTPTQPPSRSASAHAPAQTLPRRERERVKAGALDRCPVLSVIARHIRTARTDRDE